MRCIGKLISSSYVYTELYVLILALIFVNVLVTRYHTDASYYLHRVILFAYVTFPHVSFSR